MDLLGQADSDFHSLAFAARQLRVRPVTQSHDVDRFHGALRSPRDRGGVRAEQRQIRHAALGNDFFDAEVEGQLQLLRNQSHTAWAECCRDHSRQRLALQQNAPIAGLQQARSQLQQRGLAHAVGTQQRDHLLRLDAERQPVQQQT